MGDSNIILMSLRHFVYLGLLVEDWGFYLNFSSRIRGPCVSKWRYPIPFFFQLDGQLSPLSG